MKDSQKYILSIDGGGIRGILPICALVELENQTGKLSRETFSFVAGTSTGAIIAAALAAGIPASELLNLYKQFSKDIFTKSIFNPIRRFFYGSFYDTKKLNRLIEKYLGEAGSWTLNDSPIDILVTAKRVRDGKPWYFVKDKPSNSKRTGHLSLVDCVTASAAAPTYFYPWLIKETHLKEGDHQIGYLIDGGVGVTGNPVYQLAVETFGYSEEKEYKTHNTTIVSLGTGRFMQETMPTWLLSWLEYILSELLRSPGEQQTELVVRHYPDSPLYRLDPDLKSLDPTLKKPIPLDDASSINKLIELGGKFAQQIDWIKILDQTDDRFKVTLKSTQWSGYKWPR